MHSPKPPSPSASSNVPAWTSHSWLWGERLLQGFLALAASLPIAIFLATVAVFAYEAWLFFQQVSLWKFLTDTQWTPQFSNPSYGIAVIASATIQIAAIAISVALPLGLLAAIYLSEYATPTARRVLKPTLEALAGIPTIVYGYFALLFVTPLLQKAIPELEVFNALSAGLVTGLLIIPIIASISEGAIDNVPIALRDGGYALGLSKRETILKIILPVAFPGIVAACTLAISRALGETMIATIAAGTRPNLTFNPLVPVESMTAFIVQVSLGDVPADSLLFHSIFTVGLVLFSITLTLNAVGHGLVRRHNKKMAGLTIPTAEGVESPPDEAAIPDWTVEGSPTQPLTAFEAAFSRRSWYDRAFRILTLLTSLVGLCVFVLLLFTILRDGIAQLDWQFLTDTASRKPEESGIYGALTGTLGLLGLVALLAFPVGVGAAIYLEEYLPDTPWTRILEINLANMAAIPSILYGLMGLALFVRFWKPLTGGRSLLSAALVVAAIVLPSIIITTRASLRTIKRSQRLAGYAVGMTRAQVLRHVTLATCTPGIVTGMLLSMSRAIGETASLVAIGAFAFVTSVPSLSWEGIRGPFMTLTTQIFFWVYRPQEEFHAIAAAAIIVLGAIVLAINLVAAFIRDLYRKRS